MEGAAKQDRPQEGSKQVVEESDAPLTQATFEDAWQTFWNEPDRTPKQKTIKGNAYHLDVEKQVVKVVVTQTIQKDILQELREPLLSYLRTRLGKPKIQLEEQVDEVVAERRPYTNQEKLQHLLEKQPMLQDLVDKLGLDPDL